MEEVKVHYIFHDMCYLTSFSPTVISIDWSISLQLTAFWSHFSIRNEQLEVGRLRQKRIILTFSISRFNMQSEEV